MAKGIINTISLGQLIPIKSKYKTFSEVKSGEYLYIYDRETQDLYFMKVDEVLNYNEYMKRDPERYPKIRQDKNTIDITHTLFFDISYFWFKDKENPDKKTPEPNYYYCEKYAGQYISSSNFISSLQSFNWYLVGYDYKLPYRDNSIIYTTFDEAYKNHIQYLDDYKIQTYIKRAIYHFIN